VLTGLIASPWSKEKDGARRPKHLLAPAFFTKLGEENKKQKID